MDPRCPLGKTSMPCSFCPLAVQRLKAIRYNEKQELTEEEEDLLPGCKWAVQNQTAHYCYFNLVSNCLPNKPLSDIEIAYMLNISVDEVKNVEKTAIEKLKRTEAFKEISKVYDNDQVFSDI